MNNIQQILECLTRIEQTLAVIAQQRTIKEWYTTAEVAVLLEKAEFTVREWCRLGRVNAEKRPCGRGRSQEWIISNEEIRRIQNSGLLPERNRYRDRK